MAVSKVSIPGGMFESQEQEDEVQRSICNRQDEAERRQIREGYRNFMDDLTEKKNELIDPTDGNDLLSQKLSAVDNMFQKVKMTREGALDSASLVTLADYGKMKAQALKTDFITFNPADFCEKVKLTVAGDAESAVRGDLTPAQWTSLGQTVQSFFKRAPVLQFMCGSFERGEVIPRVARTKEREKVQDNSVIKATKPTQLSSLEETDRGELTTAQVDHLLNTLWSIYESQDHTPICFFEFVTNPHSFGQTVENIFYASFLIRDGLAKVTLDDDSLPVIEPIQKEDIENERSETAERHQVVLSITHEEWKEIVETFKIEEPLIKPCDILKDRQQLANIPEQRTVTSAKSKGKGKGKKSVLIP
ncbi:EP300-interacting inhibitor of differentiation 3 [Aplysia californica]|uniref:Non-structural maintenance of chromosomes element 4 n=1 Tax=Aplysia californica TaxID=6500 RepID=A0ABM0JIM8_APLCA|nr:EP300-interacting inhibitor of differentiation 3 [Aplysia californica]